MSEGSASQSGGRGVPDDLCHARQDATSRDELVRVSAAYDAVAKAYDAQFSDELRGKPVDRGLLQALAELAAGGPLVDVGCGPGHITRYLADHHPHVRGYDLSGEMILRARQRWPRMSFHVADMRRLPVADGSCAGLNSFYSIIHLDPQQRHQAFAEYRRVLSDTGWLLLAFHIEDALHRPGDVNRLTSWFDHDVDLDGYFLDINHIVDQLGRAGLHVTTQLIRRADTEVEYPSLRAYLLARAGDGDRP